MVLNPLVSLIGRRVVRSNRKCGNKQTDRQNDKPSIVTLAAHARRGLTSPTVHTYDHNRSHHLQDGWPLIDFGKGGEPNCGPNCAQMASGTGWRPG